MNKGIDYSNGQANFDPKTGIHFGVIAQNDVMEMWAECSVPDFGEPVCPRCGNKAVPSEEATEDLNSYDIEGDAEFACKECLFAFDSEHAYGDEPIGYSYVENGYKLSDCLDTDIMVLELTVRTWCWRLKQSNC
jgi:hypothetical protein